MKTIAISEETHTVLSKRGKYGETMEDIIKRILKESKRNE